jgi:hypothetical protein
VQQLNVGLTDVQELASDHPSNKTEREQEILAHLSFAKRRIRTMTENYEKLVLFREKV